MERSNVPERKTPRKEKEVKSARKEVRQEGTSNVQNKILQYLSKLTQEKPGNGPQEKEELLSQARKSKRILRDLPGKEGRGQTTLEKWLQTNRATRTEGLRNQGSNRPEDVPDQERSADQETEVVK